MTDLPVQIETFGDLLVRFDAVLDLCRTLGLGRQVDTGRFAEYRRRLVHVVEVTDGRAWNEAVRRDLESHEMDYRTAIAESSELADCLAMLTTCPGQVIRDKLATVLDGPTLPWDELPGSSSNHARNVQFELFLASTLARRDLHPELGDRPDLRCAVDGVRLLFECKRLVSVGQLPKRLKEAAKQLREARRGRLITGAGVIALSLSRVFNPLGRQLRAQGEDEAQKTLRTWLEDVTGRVEPVVADLLAHGAPVGVLFHAGACFVNLQTGKYQIGDYMRGYAREGPSPGAAAFRRLADNLEATGSHTGEPGERSDGPFVAT